MWSIVTTIAAIVSGLLGIPAMIARWQAKRQGQADQRAADTEVEAATLARERDALTETASKSTEDALKDGSF